ncbi:NIPSNAP family protein [Shewanella intestini]|uniref:NIPSNAP domain-containing protein n=1 Tax=Shewanella intestini TaxID=2017544 RepID=A0ABS5I562_9GAMM|nr:MULTISPECIES: NIPSNAP family protein [Shewanella]MBR9728450.1 hypothetical protein [Shewanella intestini]MRG36269.1 hypothetical protein [Shewanella sp. XMDDZSB0408]
MKIVELRKYLIKPNKKHEWLTFMNNEVLPYQRSKGMSIIQTYTHTDSNGNDYFIWLREFENEQARQDVYKNTYNDRWIENIRPKVFTLIDKDSIEVTLLNPVQL